MADVTYIEPLNAEMMEMIIEKERPDAPCQPRRPDGA
jgi:carbamoylphosphate synthase large subunit